MSRRAAPATGEARSSATFSSTRLASTLRALIGPLQSTRLCVAFSGGADSTALLAAAAALRLRYRCELRAVHVNHRLQPTADAMARAARAMARRLDTPCQVVTAPVRAERGQSPEAAARAVRYAALRSTLRDGEWLLLAQHQDDQAETVLLQLLRGAGVAGLAAMPASAGRMLRPLLNVTHAQLLAYLRRRSLSWIEDPSNADERFDRNYLRLRVLPLLRQRWPALAVTISRSAALAAEAQQLLAAQAEEQLRHAADGAALQVAFLRRLGAAERRNALRRWLEQRGLPLPDQRRLQEIAGPMLRARFDAQPFIRWPGGLVRRHGALLYAMLAPLPTVPATRRKPGEKLHWNWLRDPQLVLPDGGSLEIRPDPHGPLRRGSLPARVLVAFRDAEGRVGADAGGKRLKRLLQARSLPPWQRRAVPLLYAGARLIAVGDWWQAAQLCAPAEATGRCRLHWQPASKDL